MLARNRDGIYGAAQTDAMTSIENRTADRNVFEWYLETIRSSLQNATVIDWGAGVGRFVSFFQDLGAQQFVLIEPSPESVNLLQAKFKDDPKTVVLSGDLESTDVVHTQTKERIHVCNFVINCMDNIQSAFEKFSTVAQSGDRLYVITNVFAPVWMVDRIPDTSAKSGLNIDFDFLKIQWARLPNTDVFSNQIIQSGIVLTDSVHLLDEYLALYRHLKSRWNFTNVRLMRPDGFRLVPQPGQNFGDYTYVVMAMELEKK